MTSEVLGFETIDRSQVALVGGKGASLGELARLEGVRVPPGFCVTTAAYDRIVAGAAPFAGRLDRLSRAGPKDREGLRAVCADLRQGIADVAMPDDLTAAIRGRLAGLGASAAVAVRSSATAEDSGQASFAGQHDTFLNVVGPDAVLRHIRRCWASLFNEPAVAYRIRNGLDHRAVRMAVVVQRMVVPQAAGTLFTADPVTSNRKVTSIEASYGLGEALVSGRVNPDVYKVRAGVVIAKAVGAKALAVEPAPAGGTRERAVEPERRSQPALTEAQVLRLEGLGRRLEAHFGRPQDVEWAFDDGEGWVLQSRPITTLFPIPPAADSDNHVYLSVGHQQMMTDAIKPLGISVWQLTARRPMFEAGGRLFVDATRELASPAIRDRFVAGWTKADPLTGDAMRHLIDRGDFLPTLPEEKPAQPSPAAVPPAPLENDPAIVEELIGRTERSLAALRRAITTKSGVALLDFILADLRELGRLLADPDSTRALMAGMDAAAWLNERMEAWLGEPHAADALTRSAPHNVTAEMGLALLDVADVIRPHPAVVAFLQQVGREEFMDGLDALPGGPETRMALRSWLDRYGMRGPGEIDVTRPRWSEEPALLLPALLGLVMRSEPGAGRRRVALGLGAARRKEADLLERLRALPEGMAKAEETKRMIDRVRTFTGYREFPKYGIVSRYFIYKRALLEEADRLVQAKVLGARDDIFYLTLQELHEVVRTHQANDGLIRRRRDEFRTAQTLTPPRVFTSDGEVITGTYRREAAPPGALAGLPVSAGIVEGRARVILDMADARLEPGDILVTRFTDPSWTPLFLGLNGLVTEVGGLMTHGAVIAREYGLPAVVGVERATELIRDGQKLRVDGSRGYVEFLH